MLDGKKHLYLLISLFISHCGLSPHFPDSSLGKSGWERYHQDFSQSRVWNRKLWNLYDKEGTFKWDHVFAPTNMLDLVVLKHLHGPLVSHPETFWNYRKSITIHHLHNQEGPSHDRSKFRSIEMLETQKRHRHKKGFRKSSVWFFET